MSKTTRSGPPVQLELSFDAPAPPEARPAEATPEAVKALAAEPRRPALSAEPRKPVPAAAPRGPALTAGSGTPGPSTGAPARQGLRILQGGGERAQEPLESRDAVVRVLLEAGADLLLRRISPVRAEYIEKAVDKILNLFDRVDRTPQLMPVLRRELDDLEALMTETRALRTRRPG